MGFSRQENWNGLPFPSPGGLPDPGIVPASRVPLAVAGEPWPLHYLGSPGVNSESENESEVAQSCRLYATPWTVARQAPLSMGFSRQEYWSGLPFPSLGDLPEPGIEPGSPTLQADALPSEPPGNSRFSQIHVSININSNIEPIRKPPSNTLSIYICT